MKRTTRTKQNRSENVSEASRKAYVPSRWCRNEDRVSRADGNLGSNWGKVGDRVGWLSGRDKQKPEQDVVHDGEDREIGAIIQVHRSVAVILMDVHARCFIHSPVKNVESDEGWP